MVRAQRDNLQGRVSDLIDLCDEYEKSLAFYSEYEAVRLNPCFEPEE